MTVLARDIFDKSLKKNTFRTDNFKGRCGKSAV